MVVALDDPRDRSFDIRLSLFNVDPCLSGGNVESTIRCFVLRVSLSCTARAQV